MDTMPRPRGLDARRFRKSRRGDRRSLPRVAAVLLATVATASLLAGCGADEADRPNVPTIVPQTPLAAPLVTAPPAGRVVDAPDAGGGLAISGDGTRLAALSNDRRRLFVYATADLARPPAAVALPGAATALGPVVDGTLLLAGEQALWRVRLDAATVEASTLDVAEPLSLASLPDGRLAVGGADGRIRVLDASGAVTKTIGGLVRVDALVADPDGHLVAVDRAQSLVAAADPAKDEVGLQLRAGDGATNAVADRHGRIFVTDTRAGRLYGFVTNSLTNTLTAPVPAGPYALGVDPATDVVWVAAGGMNELLGYDVGTGLAVERKRFPTVRQPDSIAVDAASGTVYVASARGGGIQAIPTR